MELGKAEIWLPVANVAAAQKPLEMWRFRALTHTRSRLNSAFPQLPALPGFNLPPPQQGHFSHGHKPSPSAETFPRHLLLKDFCFLPHFYMRGNWCAKTLKIFRTGWSMLCFYTSIKISTKNLHGHGGNLWKCLRVRNQVLRTESHESHYSVILWFCPSCYNREDIIQCLSVSGNKSLLVG